MVLLILVVIFSALGTVILQRPVTRPEEMERAYSATALRALDAAGLTDIFHSWWFLGLVAAVSVSILAASIDRLPGRWRFLARPYKLPEEGFRRGLPLQRTFALNGKGLARAEAEELGLAAAERALADHGYRPERVAGGRQKGLFAEQHRLSQLAVYVVHASLLLIFLGTIVDGLWGWRATLNLRPGESASAATERGGGVRGLPFVVRCEKAGRENYPDGTVKREWSDLTVIRGGQAVVRKQVVVNDPLIYEGLRVYQSSSRTEAGAAALDIAHQPGSGIVWLGVVLMGIGLVFVFYLVLVRLWVVPVREAKTGKLSLWVGGSANRNRDGFERRFNDLTASIEEELKRLQDGRAEGRLLLAAKK